MASNDSYKPDTSFSALVIALSSSAWMGLGKIADPVSGEVKKDIRNAKYGIDRLLMLKEKTKGNLDPDEKKLLDGIIADLQANFAETVFSNEGEKEEHQEEKPEEKEQEHNAKHGDTQTQAE